MLERYSIGLDFGTLSARAILVNIEKGEDKAVSVFGYQDAVIERYLPGTNIKIPPEYALQNPRDYVGALESLLSDIWRKANIKPEQVVGIGVAFTSCTMLPVDENFVPLCFHDAYKNLVHSWVKLWKHHGAQKEADLINNMAKIRNESFIKRYGNKSSSEWMYAKILETLNNAPEIYEAAYRFIEGSDWIVYLLTGNEKRNSCVAGAKAFWNKKQGYPSKDFFNSLHPRMMNVIEEKIGNDVYPLGTNAGGLTKEMALKTGLLEGTPVSVGCTDAHSSVPAVGITEPGKMALIIGTSICLMIVDEKEVFIDGVCGVVEDGMLPGYYGYEAGQAAVGDIYDWFVSNITPYDYTKEAFDRNIKIYDLMDEKAEKILPGSSGLLALDWWNGNRSLLVNADLSGFIIGLSLTTKPEEIYRALIESTAFGSKLIIESFKSHGIKINDIIACGGLSRKSKLVIQIFSDIIGMEINISNVAQTSALGAAIYGAVAGGRNNGGYDNVFEAAKKMSRLKEESVKPDMNNYLIYTRLFEEYKKLHDYFGLNGSNVMKILKDLKAKVNSTSQSR